MRLEWLLHSQNVADSHLTPPFLLCKIYYSHIMRYVSVLFPLTTTSLSPPLPLHIPCTSSSNSPHPPLLQHLHSPLPPLHFPPPQLPLPYTPLPSRLPWWYVACDREISLMFYCSIWWYMACDRDISLMFYFSIWCTWLVIGRFQSCFTVPPGST